MIKTLKTIRQIAATLVVTLIVAASPAVASADTTPAPAPAAPAQAQQVEQEDPTSQSEEDEPESAPESTESTPPADVSGTTETPTPPLSESTSAVTNTTDVTNSADSTATSGDAEVVNNTTAGNATSGNAAATSTTVNTVQSSTGLGTPGEFSSFTQDINGSQIGDILLDPGKIVLQLGSGQQQSPIIVTNHTSSTITNDISLDAHSGNATVSNNDTAGNATSGNASAVANIINIVHSVVGADRLFVGTININGDLNGDILLPDDMQDILATQSAHLAGGDAQGAGTSLDAQNTSTTAIKNNVAATAASGDATVSGNGTAGSATTGDASTNVTIFNLTGYTVNGKNAMIVFVNVMGSWVGFIVDAPQGATAAALGSGMAGATPPASDTTVTANTETSITNNVQVNATSGNALVSNNGTAGNATSGDANASANILNMTDSNLSLGGWFGILFINVFGTWHGSFGADTDAGDLPAPDPAVNTPPVQHQPAAAETAQTPRTETAVLAAQTGDSNAGGSIGDSGRTNDSTSTSGVLSANSGGPTTPTVANLHPDFTLAAVGLGFSLLLLAGEALVARRRKARKLTALGATGN